MVEYKDDGDLINKCVYCGALFWFNERIGKGRKIRNLVFIMCCMRGKIKFFVFKELSELFLRLFINDDVISKYYRDNIRFLNMMFFFILLGGKIDNFINTGKGLKVFKMYGENYYLIGSVKLKFNETVKFF